MSRSAESPGSTDSIREVISDLKLARVFIIHPGDRDYDLNERVRAVAVRNLAALRDRWEGP